MASAKLFDATIVGDAASSVDFITNILQASTEYSIIGKSLGGDILLWNEGMRRLYGYEPEEVVGKANSAILHVPDDVAAGKTIGFLLISKDICDVNRHVEGLTGFSRGAPRKASSWCCAKAR